MANFPVPKYPARLVYTYVKSSELNIGLLSPRGVLTAFVHL